MNRKLKTKCLIIFMAVFVLTQLILINSMAATTGSFSVSPSSKEMNIGDSTSVTITTTNCAGQFSIKSSDSNVVSVSSGSEWVEGTKNITLTAKKSGSATITVTAENVGDNQTEPEDVTGTKTIAITVKAKPAPDPTPTPDPKPEPKPDPEPPVVAEPTFTKVNETVYAKEKVNIRQSYSTSAKIVGGLQEGESITRVGVGSNGWSKVTYQGSTAYISSKYLTTTKPEEEKKSDNANLKSLTIENQELLPIFSKDVTSYSVQVANNINELKVNAVPEDEKASVSINGNKDLKVGENTLTISVSAEDGTNKIYEIKVTRLEEEAFGLKSLSIEGTEIANTFKTDVYDYEISIKDISKLEIEAIATVETASVEILGNEDLQEGENFITIIVKSEDGEKTITYQIKVTKTVAGNVTAPITEENKTIDPKVYVYIGIGAILLIALIIVIIYTIKHRNQEDYDYIDNLSGLSGDLPEKKEVNTTTPISPIKENEPEKQEKRQAKIDYFLDEDEEEKPRRKKGKHF